jgi:hypothetical protein
MDISDVTAKRGRSSAAKRDENHREDEVRTTLSIRGNLAELLKKRARDEDLKPIQAVRRAIDKWLHEPNVQPEGGTGRDRTAATEARELINAAAAFDNPYQEIVAAWRIARTRSQVAGISGHHLELDAWNAEDYLLRVLREVIDSLGSSDEMLILSNTAFWCAASSAANPFGHESASRYLNAQQQRIAEGMGLCRILLVSEDDLVNHRDILVQQKTFLREAAVTEPGRVKVQCKVYPTRDILSAARESLGHFALVRRRATPITEVPSREPDQGALIVEPVYYDRESNRITRLRFRFSRGSSHEDPIFREYLNQFFEVANSPSIEAITGM